MPQQLLAIDVGNSNTVLGLFEGKKLKKKWRIPSRPEALTRWVKKHRGKIDGIIISSVVPSLKPFLKNVGKKLGQTHPLFVAAHLKMPIKLKVKNPKSIGADRLVNAVAAYSRLKKDLLIIDLGTATTCDVVTSQGEFLGGAITPGIKTMASALAEKCARLPAVKIGRPRSAIGRDTQGAIQSGIFFGYAGLVKGLIEKISEDYGSPLTLVVTGGLAPLVPLMLPPSLLQKGQIKPDLTLTGLHLLYEWNKRPG